MSEIWNLSALCRCCHTDGNFKNLQTPCQCDGNIETYYMMLQDTFGINIKPPALEASYTICDTCIVQLRDATKFRRQVLICEKKFEEYCKNEEATHSDFVKIKDEFPENSDDDLGDRDSDDDKYSVKLDSGSFDEKYDINNTDTAGGTKLLSKIKSEGEAPDLSEKIEITVELQESKIKREQSKRPAVRKKGRVTKTKPKTKTLQTHKRKQKQTNKETNIDPSLEVHVKTENGDLYSCKICGGNYEQLKKLQTHIFEEHLSQTFKCDICPEVFKNEVLFKKHLKKHRDNKERPYKCSYCVKDFNTKFYLLEHQNTHTKEKIYKCDLCSKEFKYKGTLKIHLKWHNGTNKKYICDTCGHTFNDITNLTKHNTTVHLKLRPYSCDICKKTFTAKKYLVVHARFHSGEKPYKCDLCSACFVTRDHMNRHRTSVHDKRQLYTCVVCEKTFLDRGRFRVHVRSHTGSLPHKCPLCSKDFSCKYSMKRHVNEHYGLKPFSCDICKTSFSQKTQLNRHMNNKHNPNKIRGEKVKCELCKQNVYDLEKHKKTHINRPHKCHMCEKSYSERNALNRHINSRHLGRKPHVCQVCGKKYTNIGSLRNHKVKVHKEVLKNEMEDNNLDEVLTTFTIKSGKKDNL